MMLLPVPEYPIVSEEDDGDEAAQPDNSLYKEDGSLEVSSVCVEVFIFTSSLHGGVNQRTMVHIWLERPNNFF